MARLYTVRIDHHVIPHVGKDFAGQDVYETEFAGLHFSRQHEIDLIHWVRIAARNRYGRDTQVIFLHTERAENNDHNNDTPYRPDEGCSA
jgi:hypothetical protein